MLGAVWPGVVVEENSLAQNISALRQALGESHGENRYIATVPRRGYQFVAAVGASNELPAAPPADKAPGTQRRYPAVAAVGRGHVVASIGARGCCGDPDAGDSAFPPVRNRSRCCRSSRWCWRSAMNLSNSA